jgi:hypothetical protein
MTAIGLSSPHQNRHQLGGALVPAPAQAQPAEVAQTQRWNFVTRIAFRFCFIYFSLYCLSNQVLGGLIPFVPDLEGLPPIRPLVFWTAARVFHLPSAPLATQTGSGDRMYDWLWTACMLSIALIVTALWSAIDHKREEYVSLHKWFRVFLRFCVGSTLVVYGLVKIFPLQMPFPFLAKLVEPFGNFSPMGVLWSSIGASPWYERFVGSAEFLGGILLFIPRTATLGALIAIADFTEVFTLNMTYDVPVKLLSLNMLLISTFLVAPELKRMLAFFFTDREVGPSQQPKLFRTAKANRRAAIVQLLYGLALVGLQLYSDSKQWANFGPQASKPALYGIWNLDAQASQTDLRWRRLIFDTFGQMVFQNADDSFTYYRATIDEAKGEIVVTRGADKSQRSTLKVLRASPDQMTLDGEMDGRTLHLALKLVDRESSCLRAAAFIGFRIIHSTASAVRYRLAPSEPYTPARAS